MLSFLLITAALIIAHDSPVVGYEYSVYQATPAIFWISVIIGQIVGILLFSVYYRRDRWRCALGISEILLSNAMIIMLYLSRGFIYLQRGDSLTYIGYAKDVVNLGFVPGNNFYPMISITMALMEEIIGQSIILISQILPPIFIMLYTIGMLCWAQALNKERGFVIATMFAAAPIFFAWFIPSIFHETFCVLALPLFFFVLWRCGARDVRFTLILALFIIFFILGHPLVAVCIIVVLSIVFITEHITKSETRIVSRTIIEFGCILLFGWISLNAIIVEDVKFITNQLIGIIGRVSTISSAQAQASQMGILSALQSVLICTIDDIIYVLLSLALCLMILRGRWRAHPMVLVMACFVGGGFFIAGLILFTYSHNPFRMINLNFIMIFTVPLVGYILFKLRSNGRAWRSRVVTSLILFCIVSTTLTIYQDPAEMFPNSSVTRSEVTGSNWCLESMRPGSTTYVLQSAPWRYADMIYGDMYVVNNREIWSRTFDAGSHFVTFLNISESKGSILVVTTYDIQIYTRTWASVDRFNHNDFLAVKLSSDVDQVYVNSCMATYFAS